MEDLNFKTLVDAFNLEPEDAIKIFEKKGIKLSESYKDALEFARQEAFTVTKVTELNILQDFHDLLQEAQKNGETMEEFKKKLEERLESKGWKGKQISDVPGQEKIDSPWKVNLIYRNNMQSNYMAGRWAWAEFTKEEFEFVQWNSVRDKSTTDECIFLDQKCMRIDDPYIPRFQAPGHHLCRRWQETLSQEDVDNEGLIVLDGASNLAFANAPGFDRGLGNGYKPDMRKYSNKLRKIAKKLLK